MTEIWRNRAIKMLFFIFIVSLIPPNTCQMALASSSFLSDSFNSPRKVSALAKGLNVRDTRSRTLFTKYSDLRPTSSRFNASEMESEIAAIFQEFAYGSSTSSSTTTISTSTSTMSSLPSTSTTTLVNYFPRDFTESNIFIGKQRKVYTETKTTTLSTTEKPFSEIYESQSSTSGYKSSQDSKIFSYAINSHKKNITTNINNDKIKTVVSSYPAFDMDEESDDEIQVRVTSVLKKKGYEAIKQEIGNAWIFHVYLTGILFGIVAVACLLSLSRISTCSQLLPRGYFITLHLMIFLASFLRCLLFLHDPYGAYGRLPSVLTSLLFNTVDPCLTTAYSVVLLVLLRAARIRLVPLNMQSPLVLATVCGIHIGGSVVIDVSSGVLEDQNSIATLNITTQAITTIWGSILCLGYVISFSGIEKAAYRQQSDLVRLTFNRKTTDNNSLKKNSSKPSLIYGARLFLICTLLHGLLIAFIILNLVTTKVPISASTSEAWAWWTQASLERLVEIVLCVLLLATALVLTQSKPRNTSKEKDEKIFSIFSQCGRGNKGIKNIDVYPVANEKFSILDNGTIRHSTLNSSINLSKNGWNTISDPNSGHCTLKNQMILNSIDHEYKKALQQDCTYNSSLAYAPRQIVHNNSLMRSANIYNDNNTGNYTEEALHLSADKRNCYPYLNNCGKTLPGSNYYYSQRSSGRCKGETPSQTINCNAVRGYPYTNQNHLENGTLGLQNASNNSHWCQSSPIHCSKPENEYEVAPYYTHSNSSNSSYVYTKPYSCYPYKNVHISNLQQCIPHKHKSINSYEIDPKSEMSVCSSSQSEIQVDYLTDVSSSNDGLSNTLSRSLTLPLHSQHCPAIMIKENKEKSNFEHTPDSAVGLDYSLQTEGNLISPENFNGNENISTGLLRLNTVSLNEALKNQSVFLGKFVNSGCHDVDYSPLSLEETLSTPSSEYTIIKKSISTGDLTDSQASPIEPQNSSVKTFSNELENSISRVYSKEDPVTSI